MKLQLNRMSLLCRKYISHLLQLLNEQLNVDQFSPVLCPRASQLIAAYDEHVLVSNFKFGVLYQRFGQTTEEQLFGNVHSSAALDEFLELLGQRIQLKDHKGWINTSYFWTHLLIHKEKDIWEII